MRSPPTAASRSPRRPGRCSTWRRRTTLASSLRSTRRSPSASLVRRDELEALAASGRRGSARLRTLLTDTTGYTRRGAEHRLRSLILKAQLPIPLFNFRLLGHEQDAVWLKRRLVVEVDGYAAHGSRAAFERDRRRDQDLAAAGYHTLRVTWRQLTGEPEAVIARLAAVLAS